jgi:membrane protein DedA with SNARE-associated domain
LEQFIDSIISLNPLWIYLLAIAIAYIENIFPPFPSDVVLVAAGYLCASGRIDFVTVLVLSTIGSASGFMTMYKVGSWFGLQIVQTGRFRFIKMGQVQKVESWFQKYGYIVVVVNRFLAGTRAVVSFFTGVSNLPIVKTMILASISSLVWNTILLFAGRQLGTNWHAITFYFESYGQIVSAITVLIVLLFILRIYLRRRNKIRSIENPTGKKPAGD